ncbi:MAG: hypothetical protein IT385_13830 [Deltaproteobacteria bacterium]|nr:hypothetical protein [Deltaproteobacteria bacterium]
MSAPSDSRPGEHHLTTRATEIDPTATVPLPIFLRYFEHLRWLTIQDPRLGLVDHLHESHFFVVRMQIVELRRRVGQGVALRLGTRFTQVGRSTASVIHTAHRESDGALVAHARVVGAWLGPSRRLVRLPETFRAYAQAEIDRAHPPHDPHDGLWHEPLVIHPAGSSARSFLAPPEHVFARLGLDDEPPRGDDPHITERRFDHVHHLVVPPRDLDVFSHVNAATYLGYCDDARHAARDLWPDARGRGWVVRAGLFYQREAAAGDALDIGTWALGDDALGVVILPAGTDPSPLVTVRLDLAPAPPPVTAPVS